jgi:hypothetical protein
MAQGGAAKPFVISDLRGGRNGSDPPLSLPQNQCVEALNVDWSEGTLGHKRGGSDTVAITGGTAFASGIQTLARHVPGNDETAAVMVGVDGTGLVKHLTGGTSWADATLSDAIATNYQHVVFVSLNGKNFAFYDSTQDRPHVYDPALSSPKYRRMGFVDPTTAPGAANSVTGGAYAAVLRYYRVRWLQLNGTIVVRRSEPTDSVSFTPDGAHLNATVTRPTAAGEDETHWEIEASLDNTTFYRLSQIVIATTTYLDSAATTTYSSNTVSDSIGTYSPPTSGKYAMTDGNRLLFAGAWETGGKNSRVWFTPVLGSSDQGDDERIVNTTLQKNFVDLNENDGGFITGMGGPLEGAPFVFKYRQIYKLVPTGDVSTPYLPRRRSDQIGCIAHKSICLSRDQAGNPALYFLGVEGPYRIGNEGIEYLGRDIEDIWAGINLGASTVVAHGISYPTIHQIWWWIATGSSNDPDTRIVFDVLLGKMVEGDRVRGGWAKHTGDAAAARCSVMFSNTLGATMSRDLKPYFGRSTGTVVLKGNTSATDDAGTTYQAYLKPRPIRMDGHKIGIGQSVLTAKAGSGVTITQTIDRDYGLETRTATVSLTAAASETRVVRKIEGSDMSGAVTIQTQIGDGSAVSNTWTMDELQIPVMVQETL